MPDAAASNTMDKEIDGLGQLQGVGEVKRRKPLKGPRGCFSWLQSLEIVRGTSQRRLLAPAQANKRRPAELALDFCPDQSLPSSSRLLNLLLHVVARQALPSTLVHPLATFSFFL